MARSRQASIPASAVSPPSAATAWLSACLSALQATLATRADQLAFHRFYAFCGRHWGGRDEVKARDEGIHTAQRPRRTFDHIEFSGPSEFQRGIFIAARPDQYRRVVDQY